VFVGAPTAVRSRAYCPYMDTTWSFGNRPDPRSARILKVLAGLIGAAALAGIYPVAAVIATAMAATVRMDAPKGSASIVITAGAAERNSLGLRFSTTQSQGITP